jgi:hypothetical protein
MVERFGEMALPQVDLRIRELQLRGEDEAVSLWQGIRAVVETLSADSTDLTKH